MTGGNAPKRGERLPCGCERDIVYGWMPQDDCIEHGICRICGNHYGNSDEDHEQWMAEQRPAGTPPEAGSE